MSTNQVRFAWRSILGLWAFGIAFAASGCGGQSGNEGELPAAPCAPDGTWVVGRIEQIGSGCVSVRVERVLAEGAPLLDEAGDEFFGGKPAAGELLRGRLGTIYAWRHEFATTAPVALSVEPWADGELALQLFPLEGEHVQVQWGRQQVRVELDLLNAPDCSERLQAQLESGSDVVELSSESTQSGRTALPAAEHAEHACTP